MSLAKSEIDAFFDNVIVNDEDPIIKKNRLELLKMLCKSFENYFNFSKIEAWMKKFVFNFNSKESKKLKNSKNILGGKGANLVEMGKLG